jgi:3-oxoacyl-[acyl-carrier protein] reductase
MKYIITGTSRGLGYCLAERLALQGQVAGISRSPGGKYTLRDSDNFKYIQYDFSQGNSNDRFLSLIEQLWNFIDNEPFTLILNAASFYANRKRLPSSLLTAMFEVNVFSIMDLMRELESSYLRRVFIVNSISGIIGQSQQHEYSASKHAIMGFARSLAKSAKDAKYDVMCINPGGMKTELWAEHDEVDCSDFLSPDAVADVCMCLLSIPQRTFIEYMSILPPSDV